VTDEIKKTHYDVEDIPPADVNSTLELYQQSKAVVAGGADRAERLLGEVGPVLETIYDIASANQNADMMAAVNSAWAKTQELAKIVGQQGAALTGADVAFDVLKQSRDKALDELNLILRGIEEADASLHPKLEEFEFAIVQYQEEIWIESAYEDAYEWADETIDNEFFETLDKLVKHDSMTVRHHAIRELLDLLRGEEKMNDEQKVLVGQLLKTCMPKPGSVREPIIGKPLESNRPRLADMPVTGFFEDDLEDEDFEEDEDE
jgi:hypothetical protein